MFAAHEEKEKDCISNGMYCPISPLTKNEELIDFINQLDGRSIMKQSLLAKCVHMTLYEYSNDAKTSIGKGLDYLLQFRKHCTRDKDKTKIDEFDCAY